MTREWPEYVESLRPSEGIGMHRLLLRPAQHNSGGKRTFVAACVDEAGEGPREATRPVKLESEPAALGEVGLGAREHCYRGAHAIAPGQGSATADSRATSTRA
ncbi:hypothetical protein ABIG07_000090 [Bradyrhizobium ottawaense]|uniref:Uncharacterized protein n=1 Tax=Bradyrhizobium ottawaense TaxID=931866 RepID=A0ABV4FII4_9BRAD